MTPIVRLLRRLRERLLGEWEEGPEPPARLREMVLLFVGANPKATRREWMEFAAGHAGEAYRSGYLRGLEATERDPGSQPWREHDPDALADQLGPGWRERVGTDEAVVDARHQPDS